MAFTRKMLKAMGIEEEKIDEIIEAHREVTDALKEDRDKYKADADKLADVQKELEDMKKMTEGSDSYKEKYEKEHKDFEAYKDSIKAEQTKAAKVEAFKALLKKAGVSEKRIDAIVKVSSVDDIELDDKGEIIADMVATGQRVIVAAGGHGGLTGDSAVGVLGQDRV